MVEGESAHNPNATSGTGEHQAVPTRRCCETSRATWQRIRVVQVSSAPVCSGVELLDTAEDAETLLIQSASESRNEARWTKRVAVIVRRRIWDLLVHVATRLPLMQRTRGRSTSHQVPQIARGKLRTCRATQKFLRTLCGLGGRTPPLTCGLASIQTLKRNSTTSPSAMT
jgi:hypothetical protein